MLQTFLFGNYLAMKSCYLRKQFTTFRKVWGNLIFDSVVKKSTCCVANTATLAQFLFDEKIFQAYQIQLTKLMITKHLHMKIQTNFKSKKANGNQIFTTFFSKSGISINVMETFVAKIKLVLSGLFLKCDPIL